MAVIQCCGHCLRLLTAIPGQPNAYGALDFFFFSKNRSALKIRINHFLNSSFFDFWPLGPSPCCRGGDLESNALIGIEIAEMGEFCLKFGLGVFLGVCGFSGIEEISFLLLVFGRFVF